MLGDWRGYIEVTELDPRLLVQVAYSGSRPQGLGFLHARPGGLSENTLNEIMAVAEENGGQVYLDYLHGRSMKFYILKDKEMGKSYIELDWYDHGVEATKRLVRECGLPDVEARIAAAEAGLADKVREWEEKQERCARIFVRLLKAHEGKLSMNEPPLRGYYRLNEDDPIALAVAYGRSRVLENGWAASPDYRNFTLTEKGRNLEPDTAS